MDAIQGRLKSPFPNQVAFFRRKLNVPTARWNDLWRGEHAHGFMVAGVTRADLLEDIRQLVDQAQHGMSYQAFRRGFSQAVDKAGWEPRGGKAWRSNVIYQTNVRQAYNAGRYQQLTDPDMLAVRPFWVYVHSPESAVPRPLHLAWDRLTLRYDNPWWGTHFPQNGWGCRCRVRAVSAADIKREGLKLSTEAPDNGTREWVDKVTGESHRVPNGIDPGFDYNVGQQSASTAAATRFGERLMQLPPAFRQIALDDAVRRADDYARNLDSAVVAPAWAQFVAGGKVERRGFVSLMGFLRAGTVDALASGRTAAGLAVAKQRITTVSILVSDREAVHAMRSLKGAAAETIRDAIATAPRWLGAADTLVLWDTGNATLIMAHPLPDGRVVKLVFGLRQRLLSVRELRNPVVLTNRLITGAVVRRSTLRSSQFTLIEGVL